MTVHQTETSSKDSREWLAVFFYISGKYLGGKHSQRLEKLNFNAFKNLPLNYHDIVNRPSVAGAVPQSPSSLIN